MAVREIYTGTATVGTTELDLPTNTTTKSTLSNDGVYQLFLDLSNLTATEQYTLKIYEKVLTTSTQRLVESITFSGAQPEPVYVTPATLLMNGWTFTLTKNLGTDRSISWSIRQAT